MVDPEDKLLTIREVAEHLRISYNSAWLLVRAGKIPSVRVGERTVRVRVGDLKRYITERTVRPQDQRGLEQADEG